VRFAAFEADLTTGELRKHGIRLKLYDQPFEVLAMLIARPGELITREEIQQRLWPSGTFVDFENGLNSAINRLRDALSDSADEPKFIETVPRRGYRFIAPVERLNGSALPVADMTPLPTEKQPAHWSRVRGWLASTGIAAVLVMAVFGGWRLSHPPKKSLNFGARDSVLISSFDNRTGNPVLDGSVEYALERELSNSQFVIVVPRERSNDALRLMKKPLDTKIDAALGGEICLRDGGIRVLLTGRIERLGTTYVLSAQLVDPVSGVVVASMSEEDAADSQMAAAIRRLSNRVRGTLGEKRDLIQQSEKRLEKVTTLSLHALQLYTQALQSTDEVAAGLLERALQDDPRFASGHLLLASIYRTSDKWTEAEAHYQKAFELADFTTDRERFFILGSYYWAVTRETQKAADAYETCLQLYPDHFRCADSLAHLYVGLGSVEDATRLLARLADLSPSDLPANAKAAWAKAIVEQDWNGSRPYFDRASELVQIQTDSVSPSVATWVKLFPIYKSWLQGNISEAHNQLVQVERTSTSLDPQQIGNILETFGELKQAEKYYQTLSGESEREDGAIGIAFLRGDWSEVRTRLPRARGFAMPGTLASMLLVRANMWSDVETAIRRGSPRRGSKITEGELALAKGDITKGISLIEQGLQSTRSLPAAAFFLGSESLAQAYRKRGRVDEALRVLEQASQEKARTYRGPDSFETSAAFWLRTESQLAELYREMGRVADAEKIEDELSKLLTLIIRSCVSCETVKHS
jgi:DNA-binding winged helix-turn-helix (wHTH) protein/tetratricopeptide (TPR) repeat protein